MMQVQECLEVAIKDLCVILPLPPLSDILSRKSCPQQEMTEIHHMFKWLMAN